MGLPKATKRKKPRASVYRTPKSKLKEPSWEGWEEWSGEKFHRASVAAGSWYYEYFKVTELQEHIWPWMLANEYVKEDIRKAKAGSVHLSAVVGYNCRQLALGKPDYNPKEAEYWESLPGTLGKQNPTSEFLHKQIKIAIADGADKVTEAENKKKEEERILAIKKQPSIQDRLRHASLEMTLPIEEFLDSWYAEYDKKILEEFDPSKLFRRLGVKQAHARIIRNYYLPGLQEMEDLNSPPTKAQLDKMDEKERDLAEQLQEGYEHLDNKQKKLVLQCFRKIVDACDILEAEGKANRKTRKIRLKSPEDIVKKLKFKQSDTTHGLASVEPTNIPYARILVVFNTKNVKLGVYYAKNIDPLNAKRPGTGLSVKGTTIIEYDETKSIQMTLRKPSEFLPEIKKATRHKFEKQFETLKTTQTKLNGRINNETILLACYDK
jgi:hypothetical protein